MTTRGSPALRAPVATFTFRCAVLSTRQGRCDKAIEVPGTAALNAGGNAEVSWVSCASAGNCAAGGSFQDRSGHLQPFVVSQVNGHWRLARPLVF
jgi:hypothetical protein